MKPETEDTVVVVSGLLLAVFLLACLVAVSEAQTVPAPAKCVPTEKPTSMAYCYVPVVTYAPRITQMFSTGKPQVINPPSRMTVGKFWVRADAECELAAYLATQPADTTGYVHVAYLGSDSWCD